jgi:hypothetical protein
MKKNIISSIGILAMALVFGLVVIGCKTDANDDGGGGGGVPSELVAKWGSGGTLVFEITSGNKLIMSGTTFDVSVSGKTVTLKQNGYVGGTFEYSISGNQMTITNGTTGAATWSQFSPLTKM